MPKDFLGSYWEWLTLLRQYYSQSVTIEYQKLCSMPPINTAYAYVNGELISSWTDTLKPIKSGW